MSEHEDLIARAEQLLRDDLMPLDRWCILSAQTMRKLADALAHAATRERIIEKWAKRADHGYDPEMADDVVAYWRGVRAVTDDIAQAYARYQQEART